jgi:tRNA uridine 5-carboxymethylaminomethyl modification enzyme
VISTGHYDSLLRRQQADLAAFASDEAIELPLEIDYESVQGLSSEIKERLQKIRPANMVRSSLALVREC